MLLEPNLSAVVCKAGHHWAKTSSSAEFLEMVRPQFVVVSAGEDNRFGHPSSEVLERVAEVALAKSKKKQLLSSERPYPMQSSARIR
jgi:beta-lactamase superfamily II metal-dependent hydrolase